MVRPVISVLILFAALGGEQLRAQQPVTFKHFIPFKQIVEGIDFYASSKQLIEPYEKPAAEAVARLKSIFGPNLPKGAIFICSSLTQKDSIYEPIVLKAGYGWTLSTSTPEVRMQEIEARMKAQMGANFSPEMLAQMKSRMASNPNMMADVEKQTTSTMMQQVSYAVVQVLLAKDLKYRSSRLDDMGKSPLPDWMDIGIAAYVSGIYPGLSYLQQHMDQTFSIEDIISMSRPFVASSSPSSGPSGGGGFPGGGMPSGGGMGGFNPGSMPQGGFGGGGMNGNGANNGNGQRNGGQRNMSKDEQDRNLFDAQSSTLFAYLIEKLGIDKVRQLVDKSREGMESREFITRDDVLGSDFVKIDEKWAEYAKTIKAPSPPQFRAVQAP